MVKKLTKIFIIGNTISLMPIAMGFIGSTQFSSPAFGVPLIFLGAFITAILIIQNYLLWSERR